ncbi:tannase/feruloyl esterase family alpha/beta hydrolase [Sphingomonas sp. UYP23]
MPIDQKAPSIKMELDLPAAWNGKAMMFGGGGFDGTIPDTTADVPAGTLDKPTPLGRGYAMFASDSGHQLSSNPDEPGAFALNDEARRNFSFEALKKVHDAALFYIKARYARKPDKAYMAGGSSGGREALAFAQRWPTDFDGLIVYYPASAAASLDLAFGRITRALAAPNGYLTPTKRQALFKAALETCDRLDGVEDGVISNQRACNAQFDPGVALVGHKPLRCPGGADTGEDCLSDPQIASMRVINSAISFPHRIAGTESGYPGFNAWGADFGNSGAGLEHLVTFLGLGTKAPVAPIGTPTFAGGGVPYSAGFWDQWVKYFVTRDSKFDSLSFDPSNPGIYGRRVAILKKEQDLTATDLSVFQKHGGKILIVHGTADQLVSPRATESYVDGVRKKMGDERTRSFLRYYEVPGYAHVVSTVFNASWDSLTALEKWVEIGQPPLNPVAADISGVPGRTRPLCEYPTWPRYAGKGDVNSAACFTCSTH